MASSKEELEKYLRNCVLGITTSVEVKNQDDKDIYFSNDRFTFINFEICIFLGSKDIFLLISRISQSPCTGA